MGNGIPILGQTKPTTKPIAIFEWDGDNLSITVNGLSPERMALVAFHANRLAARMQDGAEMAAMQAQAEVSKVASNLQAERNGRRDA